MQDERFTWRMNRTAGVRRQGPWSWGLSGVIVPTFADSPWSLDRQTLIGLYHADAGRVVNGANSKENRQAATFVSRLSPDDAVPLESELNADVSRLRLTYRTFKAELKVSATSTSCFEIAGRAFDMTQPDDRILFHLQSAAHYGTTVTLDGQARELNDERWEAGGVHELSWSGVCLRFDPPARVWWPFDGYNSYAADHKYLDLTSARLIAEVPLSSDNALVRVKVEVIR